jgi:hypothetical protein
LAAGHGRATPSLRSVLANIAGYHAFNIPQKKSGLFPVLIFLFFNLLQKPPLLCVGSTAKNGLMEPRAAALRFAGRWAAAAEKHSRCRKHHARRSAFFLSPFTLHQGINP